MKQGLVLCTLLVMCFLPSLTRAEQPSASAERNSISIGRDANYSTIINGVPPEQLDAIVRKVTDLSDKLIARLESQLDINERQIRAALIILGENDVTPERLAGKLVEIAQQFKKLQANAATKSNDDPTIAALKEEARKAIDAGDLAKADALFAEVAQAQKGARDNLVADLARTIAERGHIAFARLHYDEAAGYFAEAADSLSTKNAQYDDDRSYYVNEEARSLFNQADLLGDNTALPRSVRALRANLSLLSGRAQKPSKLVGYTQNSLGLTLERLAKEAAAANRQGDAELLEQALVAFRQALKEFPRELTPWEWATVQSNIAGVLLLLGAREDDQGKIKEALSLYQETLTVRTRESGATEAWADSQGGVANALTALGRLEEALAAFREAATERKLEHSAAAWIGLQQNIASLLLRLGKHDDGTQRIDEAIAIFRVTVNESRIRNFDYATARLQVDLGEALFVLGQRKSDLAHIEEAAGLYRDALKVITHENHPPEWAKVQQRLGMTLVELSHHNHSDILLKEAAAAFGEALKEQTRERDEDNWRVSTAGLGYALVDLSYESMDVEMLKTGITLMRAAGVLSGGDTRQPWYTDITLVMLSCVLIVGLGWFAFSLRQHTYIDFFVAIESGFRNYLRLSGRAIRSELWYWILFATIVVLVLDLIDERIYPEGQIGAFSILELVVTLALIPPSWAVSIRRLHDINRSGWWTLIVFTIVGWPVIFYWFCRRGTKDVNRFGQPILYDSGGTAGAQHLPVSAHI